MIVVDTSALAAILLDEPEREAFTKLLLQKEASISAANLLELLIVMGGRAGERGVADAHALIRDTGLEIAAVDAEMALAAFAAHQQFGKGRHPAELTSATVSATRWPKPAMCPCSSRATISARRT